MPIDISKLTSRQLLSFHGLITEELRERGVVRSSNNPVGDLAEHIFCTAMHWQQAGNSHPSVDAVCSKGVRYQIKARRLTRHTNSRQLSDLRNLESANFDYLAGILFLEDYTVMRAAIIPIEIIRHKSKYTKHSNAHRFLLTDDIWQLDGVQDVTDILRAVTF